MRRMVSIVIATFAALFVVFLSSLAAQAQSAEQYEASEGTSGPQAAPEQEATRITAPDDTSGEDFVSQGSVAEPDSRAARAAQKDLAVEERLPDYSQVVDNTTKGRFQAPGWKQRRGSAWSHGGSYVASGSGSKSARFKVKIPTTNDYAVYAWWPNAGANGLASRYSVQTADGIKSDEVDQRNEGGMWIKIGSYPMKKGERYVEVAPGDGGQAVADAVMVIRGEMAAPPEDTALNSSARSGAVESRAASRGYGRNIVREAKKHLKDRYRYGTCTGSLKSCTCLTKVAVAPKHKLSMDEGRQWRYRNSVNVSRSKLRPGDEVFFKEGGSRYITHVGVYSGNGNIVHASSYFGKVVESKMKYLNGYSGAKRFMQMRK